MSSPGPAVTAATPTTPDNLATASAANTAVTWVKDDGNNITWNSQLCYDLNY